MWTCDQRKYSERPRNVRDGPFCPILSWFPDRRQKTKKHVPLSTLASSSHVLWTIQDPLLLPPFFHSQIGRPNHITVVESPRNGRECRAIPGLFPPALFSCIYPGFSPYLLPNPLIIPHYHILNADMSQSSILSPSLCLFSTLSGWSLHGHIEGLILTPKLISVTLNQKLRLRSAKLPGYLPLKLVLGGWKHLPG